SVTTQQEIDSIARANATEKKTHIQFTSTYHNTGAVQGAKIKDTKDIISYIRKESRRRLVNSAMTNLQYFRDDTVMRGSMYKELVDKDIKYDVEWHRKFTLAVSCLLLFAIGAPLGAIVRKGGLGAPVVMSIIFFLIYHIISTVAE